ncbi:DUF4329 domain-containing protein [Yoonia litorea]|uniref:DUF4329 domain-containing protein n=1 Tax=Yoonia litorea TaxID=1123755 RepID=A0A1I6MBE9_9RHOB|nr:DUF4329 domain-containing protein [Yoonia litorea]SFS12923.1 protein of unknown function [Yoonia litorea]
MRNLKRQTTLALFAIGVLVGCSTGNGGTPNLAKIQTIAPIFAETDDVDGFATRVLDGLQPRSIGESREYCGLIIREPDGQLRTSRILPGGEDFCEMPSVIGDVVASFHTHGSYSPLYDNEVPSMSDVKGDFEQRIDGYVATPGGRVWHVDYETRSIRLLCGPLCITSDPRNDPADAGFVPDSFTVGELRERFS